MTNSSSSSYLGVGFNTFTNQRVNQVLEDGFLYTSSDLTSTVHIHTCYSSEDIDTALSINASASVKFGPFSGDERFEFSRTLASKSTSMTVLVIARKYRTKEITKATLKEGITAENLYKQGGDSFIKTVRVGSMFIGAYQYHHTSSQEKTSTSSTTTASYSGGVTASGEVSVHLSKIDTQKNGQREFTMLLKGYSGRGPENTEPKGIEDFVKTFLNSSIEGDQVLGKTAESYTTIAGHPAGNEKIDDYVRAYIETRQDWGFRAPLASIEKRVQVALGQVDLVQAIYKFYKINVNNQDFKNYRSALEKVTTSIDTWKDQFRKYPAENFNLVKPDLGDLSQIRFPIAIFELVQDGPWPTNAPGTSFCDITKPMIQQLVYPKAMSIQGGKFMYSLTTTYAFRDTASPDEWQRETTTAMTHGGGQETQIDHSGLHPNDIATVQVWNVMFMQQWAFRLQGFRLTNRSNVMTQWATDGEPVHGNNQEYHAPANGVFVGWHGMESDNVKSLGPVWAVFSPPSWETIRWEKLK